MKETPLTHSVELTAKAVKEVTLAYRRLKTFVTELALAEKHLNDRFERLESASLTSETHRKSLVGAMEDLCDRYGSHVSASVRNAREVLGEVQRWVV